MTPSLRRLAERLQDLAKRVEVNIPSRHDPEAFHAEKSEIAHDLRRLARSINDP